MTDHSGFKALTKIDMNSKAIESLPAPTLDTEPVRFGDTTDKHFWISAQELKVMEATPTFSVKEYSNQNYAGLISLDFDPDVLEAAQCGFYIPKDWKAGTAIIVKYLYYCNAIINAVKWYFSYWKFKAGDTDPTASANTHLVKTDTVPDTAYKIAEATIGNFTPDDADDFVAANIWRNGGNVDDTLLVDAQLIGIRIEYTAEVNK